MKKYVVFLIIGFFSLLQGCGDNMDVETKGIPEFNAAVVKYPGLLNNRHIKNKQLDGHKEDCSDGVHWENLVIHNLTLENVEMWNAHLKNVTFVDCKFIKVDFEGSIFDNVKFIRGKIYGYPKPDEPGKDYQSRFRSVSITRILFDGTEFGQSVNTNFSDGIVVMRNIKADLPPNKNYWLLRGNNLQVRMDNCRVSNQAAVSNLGEKNTLYVTNSKFINAELNLSGPAAWIENCVLAGGGAPFTDVLVIKKSQLENTGAGGRQTKENPNKLHGAFLTENTYTNNLYSSKGPKMPPILSIWSDDDSALYLYANGEIPGRVIIGGGNIYIYNANIGQLTMGVDSVINNLNLQNVKIQGGGNWTFTDLRHAKFENVDIYPPINLANSKFGEIIGNHVEFPRSIPWRNGELNITRSSGPLTFDKPPVPTLEETGLAQFWKENDFPKENY
ncbi:MAG: pentapeptide repeat-containing protein [Desulfobulbaceae bacterium]|jgi:uncharacterized protein YjbI with pentapeptide repeats|nr:pentapeptide repeat-containing protein [Desulfobulbaceae bacterium]